MVLTYRVRARNTSADSENKIHDDAVAASYGFLGGLVPGITVYAYMTVPLVERFGFDWLERGSMQVKFHQPFYHGDDVIVRAEADGGHPINIAITAERSDGVACATALATVNDRSSWLGEPLLEDFPVRPAAGLSNPPPRAEPEGDKLAACRTTQEAPLPGPGLLPPASRESLVPGAVLGTLAETISLPDSALLENLDERLPIYLGAEAVAHPFALLRLSNQILMSNFRLGPWIHAASDVVNHGVVRDGEEVSVRGRVRECFERKGHEFVVLDVLLTTKDRVIQQVRHTAIYRPRTAK